MRGLCKKNHEPYFAEGADAKQQRAGKDNRQDGRRRQRRIEQCSTALGARGVQADSDV
jgi:hypothetical protein